MDYILSIKNTNYQLWQTELLIESFRKLNLEDKLLICIGQDSEPKIGEFSKNIIAHKRKVLHEDYNKSMNCLGANRIMSFHAAIKNEYIKIPFTILHADMLLKKPISDEAKTDIVFSIGEEFGILERFSEEIKEIFVEKNKKVPKEKDFYKDMPPQMIPTCSISFYKLHENFHNSLVVNLRKIIKNRPEEFSKEKAAWILTMAEYVGYSSMAGVYRESHLVDAREDTDIIHYKHGIPPVFHKLHYQAKNGMNLAVSPFDSLLEFNPTINSHFMQQIIKDRK